MECDGCGARGLRNWQLRIDNARDYEVEGGIRISHHVRGTNRHSIEIGIAIEIAMSSEQEED